MSRDTELEGILVRYSDLEALVAFAEGALARDPLAKRPHVIARRAARRLREELDNPVSVRIHNGKPR